MASLLTSWSAHAWTIGPSVWSDFRPRAAPSSEPWSTSLEDPCAGSVTLRGALRRETGAGARSCVVVVHGLGGSIERPYCILAALAAQRAGISCLRLGLRGADRQGEDFYHGGLTRDIEAAVASAALAQFERIYVLGYSLGGHVTLRYAIHPSIDPRVRAVAAVCAPLDLARAAQHIDAPGSYLYRRHVLSGLNEIYAAVAERKQVPTSLAYALRAQALRTWDSLTIVPRFGFGDVAAYYREMSVGPRLTELKLPSMLVQSTLDPMVPPWTYESHLSASLPKLEVKRLSAGGHVAFPPVRLDSGQPKAQLEDALLRWLTGF
jgi:predicted alpha/beta-fold hydrolase